MTRVLYPGSFDPVHNGHLELIGTAASLFDEVVVAAMRNPQKSSPLFTDAERQSMIDEAVAHLPNVRTVLFSELVVDLAAREEISFIVKGLRVVSDFEAELQMAQTNKAIAGVETVFLPSTSSSSYIASKYIREIARFGGDVSSMVPDTVLKRLQEKFTP